MQRVARYPDFRQPQWKFLGFEDPQQDHIPASPNYGQHGRAFPEIRSHRCVVVGSARIAANGGRGQQNRHLLGGGAGQGKRNCSIITIGDWEQRYAPPSLRSYLTYRIAQSLIHFAADISE
jgi:hypothetical protein